MITLEPLIGRYVTLQKVIEDDPHGKAINFKEVVVDSNPVNFTLEEAIEMAVDSSFNFPVIQCPSSYPWAYIGGERCCSTAGSIDQIHFDEKNCDGSSIQCSNQPCYNYNYQR